jgi:hypothetical protein
MLLQSPLRYLIPEATLQVTCAAILNGALVIQVCDELGPLYTNAQFAALYPNNDQPATDPARLALVLVLQFLEALSDRQAADATCDRFARRSFCATCGGSSIMAHAPMVRCTGATRTTARRLVP